MKSIPVENVEVQDSFWTPIQKIVQDVMIPYQLDIMEDKIPGIESHAIENMRIAAGESDGEFHGMVFQDSDVAKWIEASAYSLAISPDPELEKDVDELISLIEKAQDDDGYFNSYFQVKAPEKKWQNLLECHELYCSGHMIEAAVALKQAVGKDSLLRLMCKNADLICQRFGDEDCPAIPGHQEIELALLRLYRVTGEKRYLDTAKRFLEQRGQDPNFFEAEADARDWKYFGMDPKDREYEQSHAPIRQQHKAVGHSVRAVYMYTAMADLAAETDDIELAEACETLWENITEKQMYITGGIGSTAKGEAFTIDYDLPNDSVYAETCASIAMVFFARRMLELKPRGEYADIMEKELFNGILSGMQMDGKHFFYVNPLEVIPGVSGVLDGYKHVLPKRPGWYACACCPPNIARLVTSIGKYFWSENEKEIFAHSYIGGKAKFACCGGIEIDCCSSYPYEGKVEYTVKPDKDNAEFTFAVHVPGWCGDFNVSISGEALSPDIKDGYCYITRKWNSGDKVEISFDIKPRRIYCNTHVRMNAGCTVLMRGPMVYCIEETDNGKDLSALRILRSAQLIDADIKDEALGDIKAIKLKGKRMELHGELYSDNPPKELEAEITAVPYHLWGNRGLGEMRVWIEEIY